MSQTASRIFVVTAPLPSVDRRALSQAWYSALHLVAPGAAPARGTSAAAAYERARAASPPAPQAPRARPAASRTLAIAARPRERIAPLVERRSATLSPLARKVTAALARRGAAGRPASVALQTESGRVHVIVRREGGALRLIALCTAELRDGVERALAQARYALAAQGTPPC